MLLTATSLERRSLHGPEEEEEEEEDEEVEEEEDVCSYLVVFFCLSSFTVIGLLSVCCGYSSQQQWCFLGNVYVYGVSQLPKKKTNEEVILLF